MVWRTVVAILKSKFNVFQIPRASSLCSFTCIPRLSKEPRLVHVYRLTWGKCLAFANFVPLTYIYLAPFSLVRGVSRSSEMRYTVGVVLRRTLKRIRWLTRTAYANEVCPGARFQITVDGAESYTGTLHYAGPWSDMPETSLYTRKHTIRLIVTGACFRPHERNPSEGDPERLLGLTQLAENLTFFEQPKEKGHAVCYPS